MCWGGGNEGCRNIAKKRKIAAKADQHSGFCLLFLHSKNVFPVVSFSVTHGLNLRSPFVVSPVWKTQRGSSPVLLCPPPVSDGGEGGRNRAPFDLMDGRKRPLPPSPPVLHPNPLWTRETVSTLLPFVTKDSIAKHKTIEDRLRREHCFDILSIWTVASEMSNARKFPISLFFFLLRAASRIYIHFPFPLLDPSYRQ